MGIEGFTSRGRLGVDWSCIRATETALSPSKGSLPVSIS